MDTDARKALKELHEWSRTHYGSGPDRFSKISFARARFNREAILSGRSFEETADFTNGRFYRPPDFREVTGADRINFTGAHIGFLRLFSLNLTSDSDVLLRLRSLRKLAEKTGDDDLERGLYIQEQKVKQGVYLVQPFEDLKKESWKYWPLNAARLIARLPSIIAHIPWIIVMWFYWALAEYGRSFARPVAALIASVFSFTRVMPRSSRRSFRRRARSTQPNTRVRSGWWRLETPCLSSAP